MISYGLSVLALLMAVLLAIFLGRVLKRPCPACGSQDTEIIGLDDGPDVVTCCARCHYPQPQDC